MVDSIETEWKTLDAQLAAQFICDMFAPFIHSGNCDVTLQTKLLSSAVSLYVQDVMHTMFAPVNVRLIPNSNAPTHATTEIHPLLLIHTRCRTSRGHDLRLLGSRLSGRIRHNDILELVLGNGLDGESVLNGMSSAGGGAWLDGSGRKEGRRE